MSTVKKYDVQYNVNAFLYITIEAENEQEAEAKAQEIPWGRWVLDIDYSTAEDITIIEQ